MDVVFKIALAGTLASGFLLFMCNVTLIALQQIRQQREESLANRTSDDGPEPTPRR